MSDNSVQNDQENRYANNKFQSSPTRSLYSHDVHSIKDRILQETQETVKTNTDFNSNPLRSIQIYLKQIEDTSQDDKNFDNQELQKRSDKGDKQNLLNQISPSTFATKDISYRIVNEILNTQNPNRSHFKAKPVSRKAENNNHSSPVAESNENAIKLFKNTVFKDEKNVFDENEELKSLQDKIDEITQKLQTKKQQLEENKKHYDAENNDVEKTDRILKEKQSCLQETFHGNSSKNLLNEKSNFNIYKDKLKQLRADLQFYEGEILKLKNTIEKQERDTFNIEQKVSKGFIAQIQDLEDAIISIESQKLGIYSKLSEAMMTHNQKLEQKAMLKEDLSSRLLQRADLVAQREDLEQLVETVKIVSQIEFEFSKIALKYQEQINEIDQRIQELKYKEDSLKQDLKKVECIEQKKNQNCTQTRAKDIQWENLKKLENLLEEKLKEMDIPFWKQFEKVCDEEHQNFEKEGEEDNQKINQKLKILTLKVWEDEIITLIKENIIQKDQPNEIDDQQIISINDIIKWKNKAETEEFLKLYSEYFLKIQETINEDEKNIKENEPFDFEDLKVNLSQIQHEIQDTLNQKEMLYNDFLQRKEEMEQEYLKEIEGTGLIFNMDENVQDKSRDFLKSLEVHRDKVLDQLMNLQMELNYFEETIKNNTEVVDEKILPLIHDLLPEIEEGSVLISALKKQQILLLETEDEVTGQLNYILEQRDQKILRIKEKHKFPSVYSTKELVDMKKIFEAKAEPLREEISNLEHRIIENDKISTVVLIEQRKLQKELNQVDQELMKIHTIRKPIISNMKTQIESVDKEIRDLEKFIEQLEIHKLTLEQRFIEKNYLSQESYQNNILLVNPPKEKYFTSNFDRKDLNEMNNQSGFEEIQKEKNYEPLDFATQQIQGFRDEEISSQKLDLSPINRSPESSEDQSKNLKKHDICELKDFSQSFPVKDFVSTINCFSPVDFKDFEGSHQNKIRTPQRKALNREKGEESQKDETSYLRNYKKKLIQKHVHSKANLDQNKNAILETRTKSLPQPFYSAFTNSKNDAPVVFAKYTSPKEFDVNLKFTNDAYGKNYLNTQNATKYQNLKDFKSQSKHLNPLNTVMTKKFYKFNSKTK